ncbi:9528_t:CDS:10 [Acaulospora morrowiae]|uniref:9528_t:CDS:1 n=1 Tax=Acaulospora morrowiae TaxID=94023 RepID=A0A9N9F4E5_9GLOM|nr:9528_t:CDS:10 [Acaulospora morrowiae]
MSSYHDLAEDDYENYEETGASEWLSQRFRANSHYQATDNVPRSKNPDAVWTLPVEIDILKIIQENKLKQIEETTQTHLSYNKYESQIELWGPRSGITQAIKQLQSISDNISEKNSKKKKKKEVWAKPVKALTKRQKELRERREKKEKEERDYRGLPGRPLEYSAHFYLHDSEISVNVFLGDKEVVLHPIRSECKSYIWYDPGQHCFSASSDNPESVEKAILRARNLYLKVIASRRIPIDDKWDKGKTRGWVFHLIEPPKKSYKVKLSKLSGDFVPPHNLVEEDFRVFEPILDGDVMAIGDEVRKSKSRTNFEALEKQIMGALDNALGTVHLFDEEIKMRIRFGKICLTNFPKVSDWSIDQFNKKILADARIKSRFATCLATDITKLNPVMEALLDKDKKCIVDKPSREFRIFASRSQKSEENNWECTFDVEFNSENNVTTRDVKNDDSMKSGNNNKIGLWNANTDRRNVTEVNMVNLDYNHCWQLSIQTRKRLSNDKFSPQGIFVHKLRLGPDDNLIYTNTDDVLVTAVCEKLKYKYWWKEKYIVEITRYKYWNCSEFNQRGSENVITNAQDNNITWGVTIYKKFWEDEFAENCNLKVGEVPSWYPKKIIDDFGGVEGLLKDVDEFLETILCRKMND